jgi:hypothetical protein
MADNELTIVLNLDDKASKDVADALKKIKGSTEDVEKSSKKATDGIVGGFKEAHHQLRDFHQILLTATIGFTAMIAVSQEWGKRNTETKLALDSITLSMKDIAASVGSIVAPAIVSFAEIVKGSADGLKKVFDVVKSGYEGVFKAFTFATQFQVAFTTEVAHGTSIVDAWKDAVKTATTAANQLGEDFKKSMEQNITPTDAAAMKLKELADNLNNLSILFRAGQIDASQYYQGIIAAQDEVSFRNQLAVAQLQELANITRQVGDNQLMEAQRQTQEQIALLNFYKQEYMTAHQGMAAFSVTVSKAIQTNLSSALTSIITGSQSAKEAFTQLGKLMLQTIVDFMVQKVVASVLEKTLLASTVAASTAAGAAIAAAWAPAAAMVSLATFGANAGPAAAGVASVNALSVGLAAVSKFAGFGGGGGPAGGATGGFAEGTDSVPAMLSPGEMIFPRTMADAIRNGDISVSGRGGAGGDINIYLDRPVFRNEQDARDFSELMGYEVEKRSRGARRGI